MELVNLGYTDIDSVRRALDENKLDLYDNARVGVQFYEDFLEKMTRNEVKLIGDIVAAAGRKYFPEAEKQPWEVIDEVVKNVETLTFLLLIGNFQSVYQRVLWMN